jgi:hypothetical protein
LTRTEAELDSHLFKQKNKKNKRKTYNRNGYFIEFNHLQYFVAKFYEKLNTFDPNLEESEAKA